MKKLSVIVCAVLFSCHLYAGNAVSDSLSVMFWNLENMFDYRDSGAGESDSEFSSYGGRHWTKRRFYAKCDAIAKSVLWIADNNGRVPDVICFAEVENSFVVRSIVNSTALRKYGYNTVHYDSPDHRGIDVALIYRDSIFTKVSSKPCHIYDGKGSVMKTRDILQVSLKKRDNGMIYSFLVNHHPSKYGGDEETEWRREAAMERLRYVCDSLWREYDECHIVAAGDFNDTPSSGFFDIVCGGEMPCMSNLGESSEAEGKGTIRYRGKWDVIDMFIVSEPLAGECSMEIVQIPFLMTRDSIHIGDRPLRTYSGPRYLGGVSDHCPVLLIHRGINKNLKVREK